MLTAFIFYIMGFLSIGITEFIYLPFVLYGTGLTMDDIRNNLLIYFMTSLPARFLQLSLITYLISRKRIIFEKVLISIPRTSQIFIITGVALFPMLNISGIPWCFYLLKNMETKDKKLASEKLNKLLKDIELYADHSNFDNVRWKLNDIGMGIEDVAKNLYKEHGTQ